MGALSNAGALAKNVDFQDRVLAALTYQARQVVVDRANQPAESVSLALNVIRSPEQYRQNIAWVIATDDAIAKAGATHTEDQVMAAMGQVWPFLASLVRG